MTPERLFVGGVWREAGTREERRSPWDGSLASRTPIASPRDVEDAIAAAAGVAKSFARVPGHARRDLLRKIAGGVAARRDDLARAIVGESGKPIAATNGEIDRAVVTFTLGAEEATRIEGEVLPLDLEPRADGWQAWVARVPVGPIAAITPFNFPLNLAAHKIAPAFAAGCPVVLKPPPQAPGASLILAEIVEAAGAPAGTFSVVPCGAATANVLATDPRIAMLSFTGSARVGWGLKSGAGRKKVALELGGNAAVAIAEDADVDLAARRCAFGGFVQAGQVCIKVQRVLVHEAVKARFVPRFLEEIAKLPIGDPWDPKTAIGPLIDDAAAERVESWVDDAVRRGARVLARGERKGRVVPPIVLEGAKPDDKVVCEEVFGPVCVVETFTDWGDALSRVNAGEWGLQAGVFTSSLAKAQLAFRELEVGAVVVNEVPTFRVDSYPYGGVKGSGFGREGVRYAIEEMTERRAWLLKF